MEDSAGSRKALARAIMASGQSCTQFLNAFLEVIVDGFDFGTKS